MSTHVPAGKHAKHTTSHEPLPDYDLPGNDLDPQTPSVTELHAIPLPIKIYGALCVLDGVFTLPLLAWGGGMLVWHLTQNPSDYLIGTDHLSSLIIAIASGALTLISSIAFISFGVSLLKNHRRHAALVSHLLILITILDVIGTLMLHGIAYELIRPTISLIILVALSVTVDPTLNQERELQRRLRDMLDRDAAAEGLLGRDETGEGYIKLNFFNLFWVFFVCSILGLAVEVAYHMLVVDPGVYQDRAGMLFGPFSPIYGFGALIMTIALNRFWRKDSAIIFLVSAIIGGLFEAAVSLFMQKAFGAVAWDYTGARLFGLAPDPIALLFDGRTSTLFASMWGILGLVWIKVLLPRLLTLINLIPWKLRYSLTSLCALLMLVNGLMTLQALDFWFERVSGTEQNTPVAQFYNRHFDNQFMEHRFQSMTINPQNSGRIDPEAN